MIKTSLHDEKTFYPHILSDLEQSQILATTSSK